ncbi:coenzyme A pyrophosphatase [Bacillus taeanensis]|uniref:Coenzyme A pyrophosphatase n=2 Tax=Bacillus taeanensis TaxID=273032 RepID=A0A366XTD3_9BACI|nr:coenzyme A pyrophosphatase [Bacillus taeanensis]
MNYNIGAIKQQLGNRKPNILGHEKMKKSAVMLPLLREGGETHLLFEVRAKTLRTQPGEICFPGGRVDDEDKNEEETAVRETCEELGINNGDIEIAAPLDVLVMPYKLLIYPFVGVVSETAVLKPNESEVGEVFSVPLKELLTQNPDRHHVDLHVRPNESFPFHLIPNGKAYKWRSTQIAEYFYTYQDYVIWGLTARILHHFLQLVEKEGI